MSVQVRVLLRGHKNNGKLAEWFIAPVLKTGNRLTAVHGFKSHTFLIFLIIFMSKLHIFDINEYIYSGYGITVIMRALGACDAVSTTAIPTIWKCG